jgi:hypothetical protein
MTQPTVKLPAEAEELLQRFPSNEPDFEAQAQAIQARIAAASGSASDRGGLDDLLAAPALTAEPGEPGGASDVRAATAPKTSFAEMARKSLQKKDDDAELARDLLAATAQSRRPNAEMVERVRAAGRSSSAGSTPLPVRGQQPSAPDHEPALDEQPRPSGVVARAVAPAPAPASSSNQRGTVIGIVGVAFGIAACVALFLKSTPSESPTTAALAAEQKSEHAAASPHALPPPSPTAGKEADGVVSPEALAAAPAVTAAHDAAKGAPKSAAGAAAPAVSSKAGPVASAITPEAVVLNDDPPPSTPAPEQKAAPVAEPPLKPAEGNTGDVPLTPSAGAVSTALSSVRSSAQACLAGQTESVAATVVFAANGHVLRVSAGGPAGACIQAALSKAHIAPFARESFVANTTIRPP